MPVCNNVYACSVKGDIMKSLSLIEAAKFTSPNPVSLICSKTPSGDTNLATVSWWTYLSLNPEIIGFAMMKTSYTGERVRETKKVVLTIPGEALAKEVMQCGCSTGRTKNKAKEFGIELKNLPGSDILIPVHSAVAIECTLREFMDVGDHYLYICPVNNVYGDEAETPLFAWNGYSKIAPAKL